MSIVNTRFFFILAATVTILGTGAANAQYGYGGYGYGSGYGGYGNPSTGAGSTSSPYVSPYQQQQQQEAQRRANTYYYQPAPNRPTTPPSTQYMYPDSSLRSMGFQPAPTQLSPQAANGVYNFTAKSVPNCAKGALYGAGAGFFAGGPKGAIRGAGVSCVENVITN